MIKINNQIIKLVNNIVAPRYRNSFHQTTLILEQKIIDSFGLIQLVSEIDNEFSIAIQTEDLTPENFASIADIADLVKRYQPTYEKSI